MLPSLEQLVEAGALSRFDRHFARVLGRIASTGDRAVLLAAALASRAVSLGNICISLERLCAQAPTSDAEATSAGPLLPDVQAMERALRASPLVSDGKVPAPLVLDGANLYLSRYWRYEVALARELISRAQGAPADFRADILAEGLQQFFPLPAAAAASCRAAETAAGRRLTIISGGPGTGKTTVVSTILLFLQSMRIAQGEAPLRILLLAPTGKAAARMSQSIRARKEASPVAAAIKNSVPEQASTIHRALGFRAAMPATLRFNKKNPLPADLVIVDEASMIDIALMAQLFEAIPVTARLMLLGDKDQLASVEAGSILSDICSADAATAAADSRSPLSSCLVHFTKSYRFDARQGIGALAEAVIAGDPAKAAALLGPAANNTISLHEPHGHDLCADALGRMIVAGYRACLEAATPAEAFQSLEQFRLLCAVRQGAAGVRHLNEFAEHVLRKQWLIGDSGPWYRGRPVMILKNSYALSLFNGDIGIAWPDPERGGGMRIYFPGERENELRSFLPLQLPAHETAFAMTIHKSQGSEFDTVAMVLPEVDLPILSRELLYTGITRARKEVAVFAARDVFCAAVARKIQRTSGLTARLSAGGP